MFRKTLMLATLMLAISALPGLAQAPDYGQTFAGTTIGGPTWQRPLTTSTLSGNCTACRYSTQVFKLASNSSCYIVGQQAHDGHIALYRGSFNPAAQFTNLVDLDDDGELGTGTSRIPSDLDTASITLTAGNYILVTSAFTNGGEGSFTNTIHCETVQPTQGSCGWGDIPNDQEVCLFERFAVAIVGISNHPTDGIATPARFGSKETAFFWFYGDQNFEVMIKLLNGCAINGKWWVFGGALTNQAYHIAIGDSLTGARRDYYNAEGVNAAAITDTNAFPCL